jgi:hypothetical protein
MRVRYSSRLDCKSLCWPLCVWACATRQALTARAVHVPLVKVCLQAPLCVCAQHYPARGLHANLRVLLANISLQAPVVDFVSATREHETANASMEIMCV